MYKLSIILWYCGCILKEMEHKSEYGRLHDIKNDIVHRLKSDKKQCKYFY